jgi:hypothetical protein
MAGLPTHRQFLAQLIDSLASSTSATAAAASGSSPQGHGDTKQQQLFPPDARPLLLTLHVLFPNLLLPALDLLDRNLVTRLQLADRPRRSHGVFIVKSLATTISRRFRNALAASASSSSSNRRYVVRPTAWNCSCASFALDAFPPSAAAPDSASFGVKSRSADGDDNDSGGTGENSTWDFGGLSLDGLAGAGENVPCCKHLLACLLVEHWGDVLGSYATERTVTRQELAGIIAGIS